MMGEDKGLVRFVRFLFNSSAIKSAIRELSENKRKTKEHDGMYAHVRMIRDIQTSRAHAPSSTQLRSPQPTQFSSSDHTVHTTSLHETIA